jgi:hypothetical protein
VPRAFPLASVPRKLISQVYSARLSSVPVHVSPVDENRNAAFDPNLPVTSSPAWSSPASEQVPDGTHAAEPGAPQGAPSNAEAQDETLHAVRAPASIRAPELYAPLVQVETRRETAFQRVLLALVETLSSRSAQGAIPSSAPALGATLCAMEPFLSRCVVTRCAQ